jgi:hypothetical protein
MKIFNTKQWTAYLIDKNILIIRFVYIYPNGNQTS